MRWGLIVLLALPGAVPGVATALGAGQTLVIGLWIALCIVTVLVLAKYVEQRWLVHAIVVGLLWGVAHGVIELTMLTSSAGHLATESSGVVDAISPRALITGPLIGLATGLLNGALTWFARMLFRHRD